MLFMLLVACAGEDRALLQVPVIVLASEAEISPAPGVTASLSAATLTLSDLRLEAPAGTAGLWGWSLLSTAHAHPGHDFAGDVAGERTGTWTVDLLGEEVDLGLASCYEGAYATGRLAVAPDPAAALEGTVSVDGITLPFRFEVAPDTEVAGLPFEVVLDAATPPSAITLSVDLGHALSYADWAAGDADGDGTLTHADGTFANTVLFGLVSTPTWTLNLEP